MSKTQLNFFHICDKAFLSADGKLNIIGDFDRIKSIKNIDNNSQILVNFSIATNFSGEKGVHNQKIEIIDKKKKKINEFDSNIKIKNIRGGSIIDANIIFPDFGDYFFNLYLDEKKYLSTILKVEEISKG